ncbi:hypothetical protein [Pseudarthrobacter sp. NPDC058119]
MTPPGCTNKPSGWPDPRSGKRGSGISALLLGVGLSQDKTINRRTTVRAG